ncbi:MAG: PilZ domain-containing protein [Planctomycetes bacterium]|nr:PilZ domain-containing protein [Planctomycetota bacterium]
MLHDPLMSGRDRSASHDDRRSADRLAPLSTELVVLWHHDMETGIRYPLLDMTDAGARILTAVPLIKGMTGTARHLLPKGTAINRPCTVRWTRPRSGSRAFEAGLRFL